MKNAPYPSVRKHIRMIISAVARSHGYTEADLLVRDRHRPVVRARHVAFKACRDAGFSCGAIASVGGWDVSTVFTGARSGAKI